MVNVFDGTSNVRVCMHPSPYPPAAPPPPRPPPPPQPALAAAAAAMRHDSDVSPILPCCYVCWAMSARLRRTTILCKTPEGRNS